MHTCVYTSYICTCTHFTCMHTSTDCEQPCEGLPCSACLSNSRESCAADKIKSNSCFMFGRRAWQQLAARCCINMQVAPARLREPGGVVDRSCRHLTAPAKQQFGHAPASGLVATWQLCMQSVYAHAYLSTRVWYFSSPRLAEAITPGD